MMPFTAVDQDHRMFSDNERVPMARMLLESLDTRGDLSHSRLWRMVLNKTEHDVNQPKTNLKRVI